MDRRDAEAAAALGVNNAFVFAFKPVGARWERPRRPGPFSAKRLKRFCWKRTLGQRPAGAHFPPQQGFIHSLPAFQSSSLRSLIGHKDET